MTESDPRVTVAISTYQRGHMLEELIRALESQTLPSAEFEVMVVDDASTDSTTDILRGMVDSSSLELRAIRFDHNQGQAAGRNAAWRAGTAPIVAFTDDDCLPTPGWLEHLIAPIEAGHADVVQGRTQPRPDQLDRMGPWSRTLVVESENGFYQTCNIAYRRAALEEVGGFRSGQRMTAGEDTDLALTVKKAGYSTTYSKAALVYHEVTESSFSRHLRERPRWGTLVLVIRHHPESRSLAYRRYFYRASHARLLLSLAALGLLALARWWLPVVAVAAVCVAYVLRTRGRPPSAMGRLRLLAQSVIVDGYEILVFAAASVRYRRLLL